jgi:ribosomal protein S18 acetylase RimI-like enzyme
MGDIMIDKKRRIDRIKIMEVDNASVGIVNSMKKLLPQLTTNYKSFNQNNLEEIVKSEATHLFVAHDLAYNKEIVGTYTIVMFRIPTGKTIRIEDVIVDEKRRGEGIGKRMMMHAIEYAKKNGVIRIELTSHSSRVEANKLYKSLDFQSIDTNVYRYMI